MEQVTERPRPWEKAAEGANADTYGTGKENTVCEKHYLFNEKQEKDILLRNLLFTAIHVLLDDVVFRQSWIVLVGRVVEYLFDRDHMSQKRLEGTQ